MAQNSKRSSRSSMRSKQLGQLLVENGDATSDQIALALKTQEAHGGLLGTVLRNMSACTDDALAQALHKQVQVTEVQCEELQPDSAALNGVSKDFCLHEKLCPFETLGNMLCVVMGNPLNRKAVNDLESMTRAKVKTFKAPWNKVQELIDRAYDAAHAETSGAHQDAGAALLNDDDLSLDLEGEPSAARHEAEPLVLDGDPDIIPPSQPDFGEPAGPTGILEIPLDDDQPLEEDDQIPLNEPLTEEEAAPAAKSKPVFNPTIKGLDTLDSAQAVIVDMVKRPSAAALAARPAPKVPPRREAKVNVDLDKFDLQTPSETIDMPARADQDMMDEIEQSVHGAEDVRSSNEVLVALKLVPDAYFYTGVAPRNAPRSEELMDIIEALPVAEVLAPSIDAYENAPQGEAADASDTAADLPASGQLLKNRVELQRAPATPMAAMRLGEGEFHKLTLTSVEDIAGEWDWKYTSSGPIAVDPFEE